MNKAGNHDVIENMLLDMRHHVSGLQDKLSIAGAAVNKSQTVNEKILIMKEYQDKVSTMNSCWRSKNRKNLVANLQHENRQMIALEEENRQLRFALKEMEEGLHLIMTDYRRVISGFSRTEAIFDLARKQCQKNISGCVEHEKFMEFAALVDQCMSAAEQKISEQDGVIAELRFENTTLRELANFRPKLSSTSLHERPNANEHSSNDDDDEVADGGPGGVSVQKSPATSTQPPQNKHAAEDPPLPTVNGASNASKNRSTSSRKNSDALIGPLSWPFHVDRPKFGDATSGGANASQKQQFS